MAIFIYSPQYYLEWLGHVFPVEKFRLTYEKLIREGGLTPADFIEPKPATKADLMLVHTKEFIGRVYEAPNLPDQGYFEFEVPVSKQVIEAMLLAVGGTIEACRQAVKTKGASANLSGGFHHAFADHGEGFCIFNDIAIGLRAVQREGLIKKAVVIDCDLHQGNGTAKIFEGDKTVFTFSIHQENNYPIKQKSNLDIGLDDFAGDEEYLGALQRHIPKILDFEKPDLVLYDAGADPYEHDQLGALKLTKEGLYKRDHFILNEAKSRNIPVAVVLGGGYATKTEDVVDIHYQTLMLVKGL